MCMSLPGSTWWTRVTYSASPSGLLVHRKKYSLQHAAFCNVCACKSDVRKLIRITGVRVSLHCLGATRLNFKLKYTGFRQACQRVTDGEIQIFKREKCRPICCNIMQHTQPLVHYHQVPSPEPAAILIMI